MDYHKNVIGMVALLVMMAEPALGFVDYTASNGQANQVADQISYEDLFDGSDLNYDLDLFGGATYIQDGMTLPLYVAGTTPLATYISPLKVMAMSGGIPVAGDPSATLTISCANLSNSSVYTTTVYDLASLTGWTTTGIVFIPVSLNLLNTTDFIGQITTQSDWFAGCVAVATNQDIALVMYASPALEYIPWTCEYAYDDEGFGFCQVPSESLANIVGICMADDGDMANPLRNRKPSDDYDGSCDGTETGMRGLINIGFSLFNIMLIITIVVGLMYLIVLTWKIFEYFVYSVSRR